MAASPIRRPREIAYAEDTLGVHAVHTDAESVAKEIEGVLLNVNAHRNAVRRHDERIEVREYEIAVEVKSESTDSKLSMAALERAVKDRLMNDDVWVQAKAARTEDAEALSRLEVELRALELRHRTLVARLQELGGYFQYLAACKNARTTAVEVSWPY